MSKRVSGFSKLSKSEKIDWLVKNFFSGEKRIAKVLRQYWNSNQVLQDLHDDFIENTLSNYYLPFAVAPNFVIDNKVYAIPMVIEESSVVAASSMVAKFWSTRGGFKTSIISTQKTGQIHFFFKGEKEKLSKHFKKVKPQFYKATSTLTANMTKRGGGITAIELKDKTEELENYFQIHVSFETVDSMGANFINSCLEVMANVFKTEGIEIVMSILSNYTPECIVKAEVSCHVDDLYAENSRAMAEKFIQAVRIAQVEPYRAVTHNKGIMNGIDAVVLATGNDFRAIEAGIHAYAARSGQYRSLTDARISGDTFSFWIEVPLALGTVGGITSLHPLSKLALQLLGNPSAKELMALVAAAGLAQNFAALRALTTVGIQKGHMKMHLTNIIKQLGASEEEKRFLIDYFEHKTITHEAVVKAYMELQNNSTQ
jgi:hydroxymethylglutaryl-CoA reductase